MRQPGPRTGRRGQPGAPFRRPQLAVDAPLPPLSEQRRQQQGRRYDGQDEGCHQGVRDVLHVFQAAAALPPTAVAGLSPTVELLPHSCHTDRMLKNVATVLLHGVKAFEMGVVCEVFGTDRSDQGLPVYDFALVAAEPPPIRADPAFTMTTEHGLDRLAEADLIAVPAA